MAMSSVGGVGRFGATFPADSARGAVDANFAIESTESATAGLGAGGVVVPVSSGTLATTGVVVTTGGAVCIARRSSQRDQAKTPPTTIAERSSDPKRIPFELELDRLIGIVGCIAGSADA